MSEDMMTFPKTWEEYEECYGFNDTEQVYTNGSRLIPSFRVQQWLEHMDRDKVRHGKWERSKDGGGVNNATDNVRHAKATEE